MLNRLSFDEHTSFGLLNFYDDPYESVLKMSELPGNMPAVKVARRHSMLDVHAIQQELKRDVEFMKMARQQATNAISTLKVLGSNIREQLVHKTCQASVVRTRALLTKDKTVIANVDTVLQSMQVVVNHESLSLPRADEKTVVVIEEVDPILIS